MPQNSQYYRKVKYPDKVAKPKRLVFVRIFLFRSVGIKIQYFPTAPFSGVIPPSRYTTDNIFPFVPTSFHASHALLFFPAQVPLLHLSF